MTGRTDPIVGTLPLGVLLWWALMQPGAGPTAMAGTLTGWLRGLPAAQVEASVTLRRPGFWPMVAAASASEAGGMTVEGLAPGD
jgi:hypothetical protein